MTSEPIPNSPLSQSSSIPSSGERSHPPCRKGLEKAFRQSMEKADWIYDDFYIPGATGLLAPIDATCLVVSFLKAKARKDQVAQADILLRLSALPAGIGYSVLYYFMKVGQIASYLNLNYFAEWLVPVKRLLCLINITAIVFNSIELAIESLGMHNDLKCHRLAKYTPGNRDSVKGAIQRIYTKYIVLNQKELKALPEAAQKAGKRAEALEQEWLLAKKNSLTHRVRLWAAKEIKQEIEQLAGSDLEDPRALARAEHLLELIQTQSGKKVLMRVLGLTALLLSLLSLSLVLIGCPWFVPLAPLMGYALFYSGRYLVANGMLDQRGWNFSLSDCIPGFLKTAGAKIKQIAEEALGHLRGCLAAHGCLDRQVSQG